MTPIYPTDAACAQIGIGFSHLPEAEQKTQCATCPVQADCLNDAMMHEKNLYTSSRAGIWGGLTPAERRQLWLDTHTDTCDDCEKQPPADHSRYCTDCRRARRRASQRRHEQKKKAS